MALVPWPILSLVRPCTRQLALGLGLGGALAAAGSGLSLAAAGQPNVRTDRGCYRVGAVVRLRGSGFAPLRSYVVSVDSVYFGQQQTDGAGGFVTSLVPGGLGADVTQSVEHLEASDGAASATHTFTVTRKPGARLLAGRTLQSPRVPLEVWGFALDGHRRVVYVHYVSPAGHSRTTVALGHTGGQCGYLRTSPRPIFPFSPARGAWTLQLDTHRTYAPAPVAPVARIRVRIS